MFGKRPTTLFAGALMLGLTGTAFADAASDAEALRAEVQQLRSEVATLRQSSDSNWLNERRAEEIKGLIRDVLSDAETRATLLQDGMMAGNQDGRFFLKSADGNYLLNISAFAQIRYAADFQAGRPAGTGGNDQNQFQLRRAKIRFDGHVVDPAWGYFFQLATNQPRDEQSTNQGAVGLSNGYVFMEEVGMTYQVNDQMKITAGVAKIPFLREFLLYETDLLAVDRSSATEFFNIGRSALVQLDYEANDWLHAAVAFSNGSRTQFNPITTNPNNSYQTGYANFGSNLNTFSVTLRADAKIAGDWDQEKDFVAWRGDDMAAFVGAAINWEEGDQSVNGAVGGNVDYFSYTVDGLYKQNGLSLMGSFMGALYRDTDGGFVNRDQYGATAYAAYMVTDQFQPFIRGSWINDGQAGTEDIIGATFGANYYFHKQNARLTFDVQWFFQGDAPNAAAYAFARNPFGPQLSLNNPLNDRISDENIVAVRAQFQVAF
ncbi:hypothetical protein [Poriferisphaera sp. WC338]|uniref:hypothetical protein n=1 Tax=Poriferisphaera sp. WC338 TaxID=3425129 RepID=UPI003D81B690